MFFHKPKFALLDESTSALDSENEDLVYENCKKLGIIMISVSHRQSTKRFHDQMLMLHEKNGDEDPEEWKIRYFFLSIQTNLT